MIVTFEHDLGGVYTLFETHQEHGGLSEDTKGKTCLSVRCHERHVEMWGDSAYSFSDWLAERQEEIELYGYKRV